MSEFSTGLLVVVVAAVSAVVLATHAQEANPFNPNSPNVVEQYDSPGGGIFDFMSLYNKIGQEGKYLRLGGLCASACTFFEKRIPADHVCAIPGTLFGYHAISLGSLPDAKITKFLWPMIYSEHTLKLLKENGFDWDNPDDTKSVTLEGPKVVSGLMWFTAAEVGIQECPIG